MAQSANVALRIRADGDEANGGGFDPSLTANMLTDLAATSATGNSPVVSSASRAFVAGDVGAAVYVQPDGTWLGGWFPIASVAGGNATLSAAVDPDRKNAIRPNGDAHIISGCAFTASPTGGTFSIDYSYQATAIKSASDGTSTASTTFNSASGNLHKAMIGNNVRQSGGSGATTGYYSIVDVASATSMTLDRASGTMTAGVFKIGGAFAHPLSLATSGSAGSFGALTTPLIAGNKVFLRGSGTNTPSSVDYNCADGYRLFPSGDLTNGAVTWIGYYGRPRVGYNGLFAYLTDLHLGVNIYGDITSLVFAGYGFFGLGNCSIRDVVLDQHGNDATLFTCLKGSVTWCLLLDSSNSSAGSAVALETQHVGADIYGTVIYRPKGPGIGLHGRCATVEQSYVINGKAEGIHEYADDSTKYMDTIRNTLLYGNAGHALDVDTGGMGMIKIVNNIFAHQTTSGKKAINCADSLAVNRRLVRHMIDYNNFYDNDGNFGNWELQTHDQTLDPQFVDASTLDFRVGANMKALGFPGLLPFP